jgi:hypothetical protein
MPQGCKSCYAQMPKEHTKYMGHFMKPENVNRGHNTTAMASHPGFKAVQAKIAGRGYGMERAGAILAAASRGASAGAKKRNPRLKRVKGGY